MDDLQRLKNDVALGLKTEPVRPKHTIHSMTLEQIKYYTPHTVDMKTMQAIALDVKFLSQNRVNTLVQKGLLFLTEQGAKDYIRIVTVERELKAMIGEEPLLNESVLRIIQGFGLKNILDWVHYEYNGLQIS